MRGIQRNEKKAKRQRVDLKIHAHSLRCTVLFIETIRPSNTNLMENERFLDLARFVSKIKKEKSRMISRACVLRILREFNHNF